MIKLQKIKLNKALVSAVTAFLLSVSIEGNAYASSYTAATLGEFRARVATGYNNREEQILINYTGSAKELVDNYGTIITEVLSSNDYLYWSYKSLSAKLNGVEGSVNVTLNTNFLATKTQEDYVDARVKDIIQQIITVGMTEREKIRTINQYVIDNVEYDDTLTNRSAYQALTEGYVVCQGYALLMDKMLEAAGLESIITVGTLDGVSHGWNLVKMDGNWYHLDSTNNDVIRSKYYMLTDALLYAEGFVWDTSKYPAAVTTYTENIMPMETPTPSATSALTTALTPTAKPGLTPKVSPSPMPSLTPTVTLSPTPSPTPTAAPSPTPSLTPTVMPSPTLMINPSPTPSVSLTPKVTPTPSVAFAISSKEGSYVTKTEQYIAKARKTNRIDYLNTAEKYIKKLSDQNVNKKELLSSIKEVKAAIKEEMALKKAASYVTKLENMRSRSLVKTVEKYVNDLKKSNKKSILLARLEDVKMSIDWNNIQKAIYYLNKMNAKPTAINIKTAEKYVEKLLEGGVKTDCMKEIKAAKKKIQIKRL